MGPVDRLATAGFAAIVACALGLALLGDRSAAILRARAWTYAGPPCPAVPRETYLNFTHRAKHAFTFDDVRFGRVDGGASCREIATHGGRGLDTLPVCQFNSPTLLEVVTRRGAFYFETKMSRATVSVTNGAPTCVLNAGDIFE
jgi:hypothetical protein